MILSLIHNLIAFIDIPDGAKASNVIKGKKKLLNVNKLLFFNFYPNN